MRPWTLCVGAAALLALCASQASAILIDNGISGDGFWQVDALAGGCTETGVTDPAGSSGPTNVVYEYHHVVDTGAGGQSLFGHTSSGPTLVGNTVVSGGSFAGQNGQINWTSTSWIGAGSPLYQTRLDFTSTSAFGQCQVVQYLDEDVYGTSNNLIVFGTDGANDFQLLTVDESNQVGVTHAATYNTATGMTYAGWAAQPYSWLVSAIANGTQTYSVDGVVQNLASITDPRYPGMEAYGTADITSAIAFDFDPNATMASVVFSLGGSPSGDPTPPPSPDVVPEPLTCVGLGAGLLGVAGYIRRRFA